MSTEIGTLLISSPGICGGRLRIEGTRITVCQIVSWYKQGNSPEEIEDLYPNLSLAQVYTALAYYHANTAAIEDDLAAERVLASTLEEELKKS
jgi:uncharacterized protein (DUF433 family)